MCPATRGDSNPSPNWLSRVGCVDGLIIANFAGSAAGCGGGLSVLGVAYCLLLAGTGADGQDCALSIQDLALCL